MDEEAYRRIYREVNDRQCHYEKAILGTHCSCNRMRKICLAEREAVHCEEAGAHEQCRRYLEALCRATLFALRTAEAGSRLPHAKAIRLQVGGLRGLHRALHPDTPLPEPIPDIHGLLEEARERWGGFEALPWTEIVQAVAAWEGRRPKRRRRR